MTGPCVTGRNGRLVQPNFVAALTVEKLGLSAVSNDGAGKCMFEALGQAFAKAKTPTDARTIRTAVVAKMMILEEISSLISVGQMVPAST